MNGPSLGVSGTEVFILEPKYLTRHGLIAGSTGTGKSRAMQLLAEQLADAGVDVFVSDVKGDASGFCAEGKEHERNAQAPFQPHALKASYWSLSPALARMRFSLSEVGPVLLSRLLELNSTQESHLVLAFSHARKERKALETAEDLLGILDSMVETGSRGMSKSSVSVIERKILSLQESGLDRMFGAPSVQLEDLDGLNVLNLSDSRKNMMAAIAPAFLLQKLFSELPEVGDVDQPKYAVFFDEAHYLFKGANKSLRDLIVTILKQIRSKGVAVFFVTQDVADLPDDVLSQLSTKVIFAQRVASAKGETALKALARSFPKTKEFDIVEVLKSLAPGNAVVTTLDAKGRQLKPEKVKMFAPATTMDVVPYDELREATDAGLLRKYTAAPARVSAPAMKPKPSKERYSLDLPEPEPASKAKAAKPKAAKRGPSVWDGVFSFLLKLLDFVLKAGGKIVKVLLIRPLQNLFRWMFRKPVRMLYCLLFLLLLYVLYVNWGIVQGFLGALKLS